MRIIIFGPQGSGKGTQAELIARRRGFPYISTGDIFRYHLKNKTELGMQVEKYVNAGQLVADDLTNQIVRDRIEQPDCAVGFVLDGYPRTAEQVDYLERIAAIDLAFVIEISDQEAIARLSQRLACKCGLSYHPVHNPPLTEGKCDRCGGALFRRDDDQPEAIAQRLAIYHEQTKPLLERYAQRGVLHRIDGSQSIEKVYQSIEQVISNHASGVDQKTQRD